MSNIKTNLQPGEEIKYRAKLHFFLFVQPTILLQIGALLASAPKEISAMTHYAGLLILFFGLVSLIQRLLVKLGSSYAITTGGVTSSYPFIANPLAFRREINTQIG